MTGRLGIDDVTPQVGDGHHPSKAVVGEVVPIGASVWREGHDAIAANVVWKKVGSDLVVKCKKFRGLNVVQFFKIYNFCVV